jgi:alpha-L-fucosidase
MMKYITLIFFSISSMLILGHCQHAEKQKSFQPYSYKYTIEELHKEFSAEMMAEAKKDMEELYKVNESGKYKADFESLDQHKAPEWILDAKLAIFYDWGPYSIAGYGVKEWNRARYPDWYLAHMYGPQLDYHRSTWGEDFHRDDFIPMFTAENFNAREVVELVKMSGAKYLVPFNKHHDGYSLWDSKYTQRDAVDMMPGRDLTAELIKACKEAGIYYGFYFSVEDYEYPMINENNELYLRYWQDQYVMPPGNAVKDEVTGKISGKFISDVHNRMVSGKIPVTNFMDEYMVPQAKDFIDKYDPDILWFDGEWHHNASYYKTPELVAYFYNKADGRKEVVANDRMGKDTRKHHGDIYTSETDVVVDRIDHPWEECRSMSESYGYNRYDSLENYLTADELIQMLVRIVAKGGNLNLMVNPDGSGKVNQIQVDLLKELGNWLKVNGEAIYGTRPYDVNCDNTQLGQPVWYTMRKDSAYAYAIIFDWPRSETFICREANIVRGSEVKLLGYDKPIEWVDTGKRLWGMSAKVPGEMLTDPTIRPCDYAWVLKFRYDKDTN